MQEHVRQVIAAIEADTTVATRAQAFQRLRVLGLDDFGAVLWGMPSTNYPRLSALLPRMASEQAQKRWTGDHGQSLLIKSTNFIRSLVFNYTRITGEQLAHARALDFGCGYGRMLRLMYRFLDEDRVVGVDPMRESVQVCLEDGLSNVHQSEFLPTSLPVSGKFQLAFAFSVFTHTSQRATIAALKAIRQFIDEKGVLCITIRPVEYWRLHPEDRKLQYMSEHAEHGYAFWPHDRSTIEGDVTYGDTSLTTEWIAKNCPEWAVVAEDRMLVDPVQRYLFLAPR